jgi:hypothetical protein
MILIDFVGILNFIVGIYYTINILKLGKKTEIFYLIVFIYNNNSGLKFA